MLAQRFAGFGGSSLQPDIADELEASLLSAEPVQTKLLAIFGCAQFRCLTSDVGSEGLKRGSRCCDS